MNAQLCDSPSVLFSTRCRDEVPDVFSILSVNTESEESKNLLVLLSLEENVQKKKQILKRFEKVKFCTS